MKILPIIMSCMILASCIFSSSKLNQMSEEQFHRVLNTVESTSFIAGHILHERVNENTVSILDALTTNLLEGVRSGELPLPSSLGELVNAYEGQLAQRGVDEMDIELIKAAINLIDTSLGGVQIDLGSIEDARQKDVYIALLSGFERGL